VCIRKGKKGHYVMSYEEIEGTRHQETLDDGKDMLRGNQLQTKYEAERKALAIEDNTLNELKDVLEVLDGPADKANANAQPVESEDEAMLIDDEEGACLSSFRRRAGSAQPAVKAAPKVAGGGKAKAGSSSKPSASASHSRASIAKPPAQPTPKPTPAPNRPSAPAPAGRGIKREREVPEAEAGSARKKGRPRQDDETTLAKYKYDEFYECVNANTGSLMSMQTHEDLNSEASKSIQKASGKNESDVAMKVKAIARLAECPESAETKLKDLCRLAAVPRKVISRQSDRRSDRPGYTGRQIRPGNARQ